MNNIFLKKKHVTKYIIMNWCLLCVFSPNPVTLTLLCTVTGQYVGFSSQELLKILGTRTGIFWLITHLLAVTSLFFLNFEYIKRLNLTYLLRISWQRARATNGKYGPVDLSKNENDWEGLKDWLFNKWILANFMSVVMTSFSNRFLHYDAINSVIITEIRLLCWN